MNDPWDVKSVRRSGQYVSCMKLNGVPLLPPVLSKECRKEMQYYKLLAKEVEKRMAQLHPYYSDSDTEVSDKTDAPELPDSEHNDEISEKEVPIELNINSNNINLNKKVDEIDSPLSTHKTHSPVPKFIEENPSVAVVNSTKLVIDLSLNINESGKLIENINNITPPTEVPERDCNSPKKQKEILTDFETLKNKFDDANLSFKINKDISDPFIDLPSHQDGPSSISSKSFTGSLIDIHTESMKESQMQPLTRQRSYTLLKPSPHLLAHLEVQSQSTGIEMSCISMSDSLSNICSPGKKRRSWDLESAKVKWSSMAMELKQKKMPNANRNTNKNQMITPVNKKQIYQPRARSVIADRSRKASLSKTLPKSEPIQRLNKTVSPVRNGNRASLGSSSPTNTTNHENKKSPNQTTLISESEDPATRVRELYEKIQKQQLLQMASLVEKQKREQMLLQQVFEEQNNLLYTQLKTICPKSPVEAKEAWVDKCQDVERGPVSLSQLINNRVDPNECDSSISTLTDTNNYINHCDSVLKKSRDITDSLKKHATNQNRSMNVNKMESRSQSNQDGSVTRTHTPVVGKNPISRKLYYDSSTTSDQEYEPMLTDRTNDTMADVNITFPSDQSDGSYHSVIANKSRDQTFIKSNTIPLSYRSTNSAVSNMEKPIQTSIKSKGSQVVRAQPTARECAAATKIVAYAKGYLVRRLMRTERVQSTVQTIKDALLCALELHQDREGIRGADVDLHRRLIQQITAACYSLHDTFVASSPAERCAMIAADRGRRRSLANRPPSSNKTYRQTDIMSQSFSGSLPSRNKRTTNSSIMTQSNYETFSSDKSSVSRARYLPSPRRRPWR